MRIGVNSPPINCRLYWLLKHNILIIEWWSSRIKQRVVLQSEEHSRWSTKSRRRWSSTTSVSKRRHANLRARDLNTKVKLDATTYPTCSPSNSRSFKRRARHSPSQVLSSKNTHSIKVSMGSSIWKISLHTCQNPRIT